MNEVKSEQEASSSFNRAVFGKVKLPGTPKGLRWRLYKSCIRLRVLSPEIVLTVLSSIAKTRKGFNGLCPTVGVTTAVEDAGVVRKGLITVLKSASFERCHSMV